MNTPNWTDEEAQNALQNIVKRATTDREFRELVLKDPATAVMEATGKPLPEGFVINVVENDGADLTVVLPDAPQNTELTEQQLESVAGGKNICAAGTCGASDACGVTDVCGAISKVQPCVITKAFTS